MDKLINFVWLAKKRGWLSRMGDDMVDTVGWAVDHYALESLAGLVYSLSEGFDLDDIIADLKTI